MRVHAMHLHLPHFHDHRPGLHWPAFLRPSERLGMGPLEILLILLGAILAIHFAPDIIAMP
jgi:hypothetical protein